MKKSELNDLIMKYVPSGASLSVEVGSTYSGQVTRQIRLRCSVSCFPSPLFACGHATVKSLDCAITRSSAETKAAKYLKWVKQIQEMICEPSPRERRDSARGRSGAAARGPDVPELLQQDHPGDPS
jgi:hypothetical protein